MFRLDGSPENDYPHPGHRGQMTTQAIQAKPDGDSAALTALSEEQRSRVSDALGAAYSEATRRVYDSLWAGWVRWAEDHGVRVLPAAPVHVAAYVADRADWGSRPATLRIALAAIAFAHRVDGLDSPTADEGVRTTMRGLARTQGGHQKQAPGLTQVGLAAIRAVACLPRSRGSGWTSGDRPGTLEVRTKTPLVKSDWSGGTEVARINDPLCPARMAPHQACWRWRQERSGRADRRLWRGFRPSTRLCRPPASDWPQLMPSTAGTASWYVRSTAPASLQAVPDAPTCAAPPSAADDSPNTLRFSATHEPAEAAPPEGEGSASDRCPCLIPHTALLAGTLRRPPRRTGRLSVGGCDPF